MNRYLYRSLSSLFLLVAVLGSSALAQGELVVGLQGDIIAVDPAFTYDFTTSTVVNQVTEGLLKFNNGETLEPNLAERWENPDPLTYIYYLRQGVTFQDGTPMTADDVVFSLERTRNPDTASYVGWMFNSVDTIEKVDDMTVKVTLTQPDALWQYVPATTAGHVISKAHYEANPETYGKPENGALGTGPFKFVSWATGSEIVIEKYDGYWNKANGGPYLDRVTYKILPEATTRVAGLQTGEIDLVIGTDGTPADQIPIVQGMDNVTLTFTDSYYSNFLAFNTQRPPFDNVKVRQALNYALDKQALMQNLYPIADAVSVAKAVDVMPRLWTFEKDKWATAYEALPSYAVDMEKAKTLLEESGVADQLNGTSISTDENPLSMGMALALQGAVAELGYQIEINKLTYQENTALAFSGARDYDIISNAWGSDFPDPSGNLLPVFHSRYVGDGGSNFGNYINPEVDKLLDDQNALTDTAARTDLMVQAQQLIADDSAWIVVMHPKQVFVLSNEYEGYTVTPLWYWDAFLKDIKMK
jgi:peptide/nickel transport system substrate-binding protein